MGHNLESRSMAWLDKGSRVQGCQPQTRPFLLSPSYSVLRVAPCEPGHSDAFPAGEVGWWRLGGDAGDPVYSSFRRSSRVRPRAGSRRSAGRMVLALSGQIWRWPVDLLFVAVLLWKEPEVAWKGVPAYSKNKACPVGFSDLLADSVCPPSSSRRGVGKSGWRANVACGEFVKLQEDRDAADSWRSTSVAQVWLPTQYGAGRQSGVYYMVAKLATMI